MSESKISTIKTAQLNWSDQSAAFLMQFDAIDFNSHGDLAELDDLYIQGNQLRQRWEKCLEDHFCIAETEFDSGVNFLLTSMRFEKFLNEHPEKPLKHLFFSSFDRHLRTQQALQKTLKKWPSLYAYAQPLIAQYPLPLKGCHRLHFGSTTLDLWFDDVVYCLPNLYRPKTGLFDCWYLNGFTANEKPEIYHSALFTVMAKTSKQFATLATLNDSETVRELLGNAGFSVFKRDAYATKPMSLIGTFNQPPTGKQYGPNYRPSKTTSSKDIAIIGGGISSACLSLALIKRGYHVTLYCKDKQLGHGASGNQQGALYPLLNAQHNALSQLFANSFLYARNYVEYINQTHPFDFDFSGLLQLYYDAQAGAKLDKILQADLPKTLVHKLSAQQSSQIAQLDINQQSLCYPLAGWLSPTQMVNAIFDKAIASGQLTIKLQHHLNAFEQQQDQRWLCQFEHSEICHDLLVLTTAMQTLDFKQCEATPLSAARGQVTHIKTNPQLQSLRVTLCHEGYLTPVNKGFHCMGATFKRHDLCEEFSQAEQQDNKQKLAKCITDKDWVADIDIDHQNANVGIRCTTRDHFPYMGAVANYAQTKIDYQTADKQMPTQDAPFYNNLFMLSGLGSRGLNTAPLLAETLAGQINGEPLPISVDILSALQTNRQWINYLKKGKTLKF